MGESLVEVPTMEKKMDESVKSGARLDVSVSFGRFENDVLAWEKWSSFSPNKYLEEVGSLSTPGSVAQKKAYFEAHYKRIAAARKAEESDQDSLVTPTREDSYNEDREGSVSLTREDSYTEDRESSVSPTRDVTCTEDHCANLSAVDTYRGLSNSKNAREEIAQEAMAADVKSISLADEAKDDSTRPAEVREENAQETIEAAVKSINLADEAKDDSTTPVEVREENTQEAIEAAVKSISLADDAKDDSTTPAEVREENAQEAIEAAVKSISLADEAKDDSTRPAEVIEQVLCISGSMGVVTSEEKEDPEIVLEFGSSTTGEAMDELNFNVVEPEVNVREEAMLEVETPRKESLSVEKVPQKKNGVERPSVVKKKSPKLNSRSTAQKATPTKKEANSAGTKKRVVSPVVKPSQASTPRQSKPSSISTPMPASQSLKKKFNASPLTKSSNFSGKESRRAPPTSLHMSLSLGPTNSSAAIPMTRKSLIMEQMGDKDIVKRAFKSFQNRTNVSSTDEKSSIPKQVPSTASKPKVSMSHTPAKGTERLRKDVEKVSAPRGQAGTRSSPVTSRPQKGSVHKNTMAVSSSVGLKSDERAEKRKEFLRKLEVKSIAREAENAQLNVKTKEEKESEIRKLRQSLNFKAKPMPSFYRGKLHPDKESIDNEMHH